MKSFDQYIESIITEKRGYISECIDRAITVFGQEHLPARRGYIYSNGSFLNLGDYCDHRIINEAFIDVEGIYGYDIELPADFPMEPNSRSKYMIAFMYYGSAVRWAANNGELIMSWIRPPNGRQKNAFSQIIEEKGISDVSIDVYNTRYQVLNSAHGNVEDEKIASLIYNG